MTIKHYLFLLAKTKMNTFIPFAMNNGDIIHLDKSLLYPPLVFINTSKIEYCNHSNLIPFQMWDSIPYYLITGKWPKHLKIGDYQSGSGISYNRFNSICDYYWFSTEIEIDDDLSEEESCDSNDTVYDDDFCVTEYFDQHYDIEQNNEIYII